MGRDFSNNYQRLHNRVPVSYTHLITKARTLLGWEPKIQLEEGLQLSLDYFRKAVAKEATTAN